MNINVEKSNKQNTNWIKLQLCLFTHNWDIIKEMKHKPGIVSFRTAFEGIGWIYSNLQLDLKHGYRPSGYIIFQAWWTSGMCYQWP